MLYKTCLSTLIALAVYNILQLYTVHTQTDYYWRADTTAFYTAAKIYSTGEAERLYDLELQKKIQLELLNGKSFAGGLLPYNYPPHFASLLSLASHLSLRQFYFLFLAFQLTLVFVMLILIASIKELNSKEKLLAVCLFLAQDSLNVSLFLGALSLSSCLALLLLYLGLRHSRNIILFIAVSLLTLKPQFLAILLPVVALFSAANIFTCILVALSVLSVCLLSYPYSICFDFISLLKKCSLAWNELGIYPEKMINLKSVLANIFGDAYRMQIDSLTKICFFLSVSIIVLFICRIRFAFSFWQKISRELLLSLSILAYMVFAVHVNPQDALVLSVPALLIYLQIKESLLMRKLLIFFIGIFVIGINLVRAINPDILPFLTFAASCTFLMFTLHLIAEDLNACREAA